MSFLSSSFFKISGREVKGEATILEERRPKDDLDVIVTYRRVTHMCMHYALQEREQQKANNFR